MILPVQIEKPSQGSGVAIEQVATAELIPYARNARTHSDQFGNRNEGPLLCTVDVKTGTSL